MAVRTSASAVIRFKANLSDASDYIDVAKIRDIKLDINRDALETTGIGQQDRTYAYGIRGTSGSGTLIYDPLNASAVAMANRILSDNQTLSGLQIVLDNTSSSGTFTSEVLITAVGPGVSVGDLVTIPVSFTVSGKPTGAF